MPHFCYIAAKPTAEHMPLNKNAYLRYIHIHTQIKRNRYKKGYPTKNDLLYSLDEEGLKVSGSQVEKDLSFLRNERRAPLIFDAVQRCYRYTDDWEFDVPITPELVRTIKMLINKLTPFAEAQEFRMIRDSIDRLSAQYHLSQHQSDDKFDKYILFEYTKGFTGRHILPVIYDAIFESREIQFSHCRFDSDEPSHRTLQPYMLKEHRNRWYVVGKEGGEPRIFGLERISGLTTLDRWFTKDTDFYDEIFRVFYDSIGVMAFGFPSEDVVLEFESDQANYVKTLMLHRSQQITDLDKGRISVSMHVKITHEFIMECVLRFGSSVRVVEPHHLADKVKAIHRKALENG
jgi:predicted DNA-binding transcriptional regulator YafY